MTDTPPPESPPEHPVADQIKADVQALVTTLQTAVNEFQAKVEQVIGEIQAKLGG